MRFGFYLWKHRRMGGVVFVVLASRCWWWFERWGLHEMNLLQICSRTVTLFLVLCVPCVVTGWRCPSSVGVGPLTLPIQGHLVWKRANVGATWQVTQELRSQLVLVHICHTWPWPLTLKSQKFIMWRQCQMIPVALFFVNSFRRKGKKYIFLTSRRPWELKINHLWPVLSTAKWHELDLSISILSGVRTKKHICWPLSDLWPLKYNQPYVGPRENLY